MLVEWDVWAISLFKGIKEDKEYNKNCSYCSKNKCYLLEHSIEIKCICSSCVCEENSCLFIGEANLKQAKIYVKKDVLYWRDTIKKLSIFVKYHLIIMVLFV